MKITNITFKQNPDNNRSISPNVNKNIFNIKYYRGFDIQFTVCFNEEINEIYTGCNAVCHKFFINFVDKKNNFLNNHSIELMELLEEAQHDCKQARTLIEQISQKEKSSPLNFFF